MRRSAAARTLVVWCPDWPVVAAGIPLDQPALVLHANRVVACSPAARAEGVSEGLRRREAQGRSPAAIVLAHDPARDARAFEPVVAALDAVAPRVEVRLPGSCALATRGPARYFGGDHALADTVTSLVAVALDGRGQVAVGVADGAFAAACAARTTGPGRAAVVVPPGESAASLAAWPTSTVTTVGGIEAPAVVDVLVRLGLTTLGAVATLPPADVLARFGPDGELVHRLARGLDARPLDARHPAPDLTVTAELDPPVERVDTAAFLAVGLADELHRRLDERGLAAIQVGIAAETEHGERHERFWRHEGALTPAAIAERVRWQLDGWLSGSSATRPTAGITRLVLTPDEVVAARGRQLGFWGGESRVDERAVRALARVQALLGTEAVTVPERRGGRGPAERLVLVPVTTVDLTAPRPTAQPDGAAEPWPGRVPPPAPAVVPPDPPAADLLAADGASVGVTGRGAVTAPPAEVAVDGAGSRKVVAWAGPWPVDERWWDPAAHRRRARVQVLDDTGTARLLVIEDGRWRLEATYD